MILKLAAGATVKQSGFILHEKAKQYYWEGTGFLSVKSFYHGFAYYDTGLGRYKVDNDSYLILNQGRQYSIIIDSPTRVESFCVFFDPEMLKDIYRCWTMSPERLLELRAKSAELEFFERTYPHDDVVSPLLFRLCRSTALPNEEGWWEERLHELLRSMLFLHQGIKRESDALSSLRKSTREELYRRLFRARDFMAASYHKRISLEQMARVACLSPNHFLRTFKQLFRHTPHQYLTAIRLKEAQHLLEKTDLPVTEICFAVGFESIGSFSWLFRRKNGIAPGTYRRQSFVPPKK